MVNIRTKGQTGEREVADALNYRASLAFQKANVPFSWSDDGAQRNQLQTAVGGCDLTNTWGLAVEIKRQEQLSVNTWWAQCVKSAERLQQEPVLIYRQSRQPWRVVMNTWMQYPLFGPEMNDGVWQKVRSEIQWDEFLSYYQERVYRMLLKYNQERVMATAHVG